MYSVDTDNYFGSMSIDFVTVGQKVYFVINDQAFVMELPLVDKGNISHSTLFRINLPLNFLLRLLKGTSTPFSKCAASHFQNDV